MGQHEDVLKLSFVEVCRQYGFGAEDGLKILETEFNRRVDNSYGNFIMAVCIEEAFEDQRRRKVKFNKNRALIHLFLYFLAYVISREYIQRKIDYVFID